MTGSRPDGGPIVVGVDASESARFAVQWAADLAAAHRCPLHLVHVVPGYPDDPPRTVIPTWLREEMDAAIRVGADPTDSEIVPGATDRVLLARARDAQLLVVGSYGDAAWSGMLAGPTALGLAGAASCPVAVVRGRSPGLAPSRSGPVVAGIEGGTPAGPVLETAAELAAASAAELHVVHFGETREGLEVATMHERFPGLAVRWSDVADPAAPVLLDMAGRARAIVVADPGGSAPQRAWRGLVEAAGCPVVVVPVAVPA